MSGNSSQSADAKALSDTASRFIARLHSGEATQADREVFAAWRALRPAHEAAAREAQEIWSGSADRAEVARSGTPGAAPKQPAGNLFALLLLLCLAGGGALLWTSGAWRIWRAAETTGVAQTRTMALADGSRVTLNARTAIDVAMGRQRRRITLFEGEAFFDVSPDDRRPFEVEVDGVTVMASDAAFDVRRREDGEIGVAVSEHAVEVAPRHGAARSVVAGHQATIGGDGRVAAVEAVDTASVGSWRRGLLVADNRPLGAVVEALRGYHPGWIVMRDPALARLKVNAMLDLTSPETALRTLARRLPIEVSTISSYVILIEPR